MFFPKYRRIGAVLGLALEVLMAPLASTRAEEPAWWAASGARTPDAPTNDFALVNQGQLKNMAQQAAAQLDAHLPGGGAGSAVHALVGGWSPVTPGTNDFAVVNTGQLKAVAKPFYDHFRALGYTDRYPWTGATAPANDFAAANIGQLKNLFCFEPALPGAGLDLDGNGLADHWELQFFGHTGVASNALAPGSSLLTNLQAYQLGLNPNALSSVGDPIPDSWKIKYGFSISDAGLCNRDDDGDGLSNWEEFLLGTDPTKPDTDGDGINDDADLYPLIPNPQEPSGLIIRVPSYEAQFQLPNPDYNKIDFTAIRVQWTASTESTTGFNVERRENLGAWHQVETLPVEASTYDDQGLLAGRHYQYRITATNNKAAGQSQSAGITVDYEIMPNLRLLTKFSSNYRSKNTWSWPEFTGPGVSASVPPKYYLTRQDKSTYNLAGGGSDENGWWSSSADGKYTFKSNYLPSQHTIIREGSYQHSGNSSGSDKITGSSSDAFNESAHNRRSYVGRGKGRTVEVTEGYGGGEYSDSGHSGSHPFNFGSYWSGDYILNGLYQANDEQPVWARTDFDPGSGRVLYSGNSNGKSGGSRYAEYWDQTASAKVAPGSYSYPVWTGTCTDISSSNPTITYPIHTFAYGGGWDSQQYNSWGGLLTNTSNTQLTYSKTTNSNGTKIDINSTTVLESEYDTKVFIKDVTDDMPDYPKDWDGDQAGWVYYSWSTYSPDIIGYTFYGKSLAEQELSRQEDFYSSTKSTYKFKIGPSVPYTLTWKEVFVPDDDPFTPEVDESKQVVILKTRNWTLGEYQNESPEYEIDPSKDERRNGHYTLAIQPVHIAAYGVGEAGKNVSGQATEPGVVLTVNDGDVDADGVPDYADGYNLDKQDENDDDNSYGVEFTALSVYLAAFDRSHAKIRFTYEGSDPNQVTYDANTGLYKLPNGSKIRLWTKNNWQTRKPQSVDQGGDYIAPGTDYSCSQLNITDCRLTVYVEAVQFSGNVADIPIKVEVDPIGTASYVWSDQIRVTAIGTRLMAADANGNAVPAAKIEYSHPSPVIDGTPECANVRADSSGSRILGSISINAHVLSEVCDYTEGEEGQIKRIDVYLNDERMPRFFVPALNIRKGTSPASLTKPFPFSADYQRTVNAVELSPGTNVIRLVARDPVYGIQGYAEYSIEVTPTYQGTGGPILSGQSQTNQPSNQTNTGEDEDGPTDWRGYHFTVGPTRFTQGSLGGEFHPYLLRYDGPVDFLRKIQEATAPESLLKLVRGPDQHFYTKMRHGNAPAVLLAMQRGANPELWNDVKDHLGQSMDFYGGFARGFLAGGVSLYDGTVQLLKFASAESIKFHPLGMTRELMGKDPFRQEINFAVEAYKFSKVAADLADELRRDQVEKIAAVILGETDVSTLSEPLQVALSDGAEFLVALKDQFVGLPPAQQGYYTGRAMFEIVSLVAPYAKAGRLAELTKLRFLQELKLVRYFQQELAMKRAVAALEEFKTALSTTKMCFVAGTPVWTREGLRAIETLRAGDWVLSRDPVSGRQEYRRVVRVLTTHPRRLYRVAYAGGDRTRLARGALAGEADGEDEAGDESAGGLGELVCTGEHPFYVVERGGFVPAAELAAGAHLVLAGGGQARVQASTLWREAAGDAEPFTTYNLVVADFHTYFVGEEGVWVHNEGTLCSAAVEAYTSIFLDLRRNQSVDDALKEVLRIAVYDNKVSTEDASILARSLLLREGRSHLFDLFGTYLKHFDVNVPSAAGGESYITYAFKNSHDQVVYVGRSSGPGNPATVLRNRLAKGHNHFDSSLTAQVIDVQKSVLSNRGAEEFFIQAYREIGSPLTNVDESLSFSNVDRSVKSITKLDSFFEELFAR